MNVDAEHTALCVYGSFSAYEMEIVEMMRCEKDSAKTNSEIVLLSFVLFSTSRFHSDSLFLCLSQSCCCTVSLSAALGRIRASARERIESSAKHFE